MKLNGMVISAVLVASACTTDMKVAREEHDRGEWALAAKEVDKACPNELRDGRLSGFKGRGLDQLWIGVQKTTILADAGRLQESDQVGTWVSERAFLHRDKESWYARNPLDTANWDAAQFITDAGQAVAGADQTEYELQPYEMILLEAYLGLNEVLGGSHGNASSHGQSIATLQSEEGADLARAGENLKPAPVSKMDGIIAGALPAGARTDFSTSAVFTLGDFTGTSARLEEAIRNGRASGAADPRVAFATAVRWMLAMLSRDNVIALGAAESLAKECGAKRLAAEMKRLAQSKTTDFVLVLVDSGRGPERTSFDVRVPLVIPGVGAGEFRGVYPSLKFRADDRPNQIDVVTSGGTQRAEPLTSIDAVVARNFQRRQAALWWTPTIRAAIRTTASLVAQAAQDKDSIGRLGALVLGVAVAEAEQPDLRCWSTLPATQHAVIVPRPANGEIRVALKSPTASSEMEIAVPNGPSVVYVRALTPALTTSRVAALPIP